MKTLSTKPSQVLREWYLVDAEGKTLGRLASRISAYLRGKHKPEFTPHVDTGDYIIVVNAKKIKVTGNKAKKKLYHSHSGYPGGIRTVPFERLIRNLPKKPIQFAVKGMLPKGSLGRSMFKKLKVYPHDDHPHISQKPKELVL
jgi:large subunit ribosomal protein L13